MITPELKLILYANPITLTLTETEGAVLTLMLYRSLHIRPTWQQHHNCRIVCELSLRILIAYYPKRENPFAYDHIYHEIHAVVVRFQLTPLLCILLK